MTVRAASPQDIAPIVQLIRDLGEYENALHEVKVTVDSLTQTLFGPNPAAFAHVVEHRGDNGPVIAGFAIWFVNFSTWLGKHGIYLEDLYVRPELRGHGYGKALLVELAKVCVDRNYGRFEWSCLDWNEPSIGFYKSMSAESMDEWTTYRLTGEALCEVAAKA